MHTFSILSIIATLASVNAKYSGYNTCDYGVLVDNKGKCCAPNQIIMNGCCSDPPAPYVQTTTTPPCPATTPPSPYVQTTTTPVITTTSCQITSTVIASTIPPSTLSNYVQSTTQAYYAPTGYSSSQQVGSSAVNSKELKAAVFIGIVITLIC